MIRASKDFARLEHILDAIGKATASVKGLTLEQFLANPDKTAAAERYVTIVGEAANMVSDEVKAKYPQVPWREASDMRNFIMHEYMKVDDAVVWAAIKNDFPELERLLKDICASFPWPLD
jgi:uncharacterized protein with HEPN domain